MPSNYEALRDEANQRLIEFLIGELQMGATWANTALVAKDTGATEHYLEAKESAEKVAKTVRRFMELVKDDNARLESGSLKLVNRFITTISLAAPFRQASICLMFPPHRGNVQMATVNASGLIGSAPAREYAGAGEG